MLRGFRAFHVSSVIPLIFVAMTTVPAAAQNTPITIRADRILDGRGNTIDQDVTITIFNGRIVAVGSQALGRGRFGGRGPTTPTYDLTGLTILPGLIDSHAHIAWYFDAAGRLHTASDGDTPTRWRSRCGITRSPRCSAA